jgi:hypothetical protein
MISQKYFIKIFKTIFNDSLESDGFSEVNQTKSKGYNVLHYNRKSESYVHCIDFYVDHERQEFYFDVGADINFMLEMKSLPIAKCEVCHCEFSLRSSELKDSTLYGKWQMYDDEERNVNILRQSLAFFKDNGLAFFAQFRELPNDMDRFEISHLETRSNHMCYGLPLESRLALYLAKYHQYMKNDSTAIEFAKWGLKYVGNATGLIPSLNNVVQGITTSKFKD